MTKIRKKLLKTMKLIRDELYYSELLELRNFLFEIIDDKVDNGYTKKEKE